ncbi:hypothetical protein CRUP_032074 [Coryphaenoides rupestris]|nr:hypothetical protein CRUP_032074 [Coryphaenoides rupestris]
MPPGAVGNFAASPPRTHAWRAADAGTPGTLFHHVAAVVSEAAVEAVEEEVEAVEGIPGCICSPQIHLYSKGRRLRAERGSCRAGGACPTRGVSNQGPGVSNQGRVQPGAWSNPGACPSRGRVSTSLPPQGLLELRGLLHDLPVANFNLLNYICQFLNEVQSYSCSNKMSCQNLATVFGPNILRAKAEDPHSIIGGAAVVQVLMLELIREHRSLFPREAGPCPARAPGKPQDPTLAAAARVPVSPCARQLSLPLIAERWGRPGSVSSLRDPREPPSPPPQSASKHWDQRVLGHRHTSSHPDSCLFPLPSTSYPLSPLHHHNHHHHQHQHHHHAARPGIPQPDPEPPRGAQDSIAAPATGLFPVHAPSSLLLQSCAADGPAVGALLPGRMEEEGACPWTAGAEDDVAVAEEEGAVPEEASGGSSEFQEEDSCLSVYDNMSRASLCQGMEAQSEAPHVHSHLTELRQQMTQQSAEYQATISR